MKSYRVKSESDPNKTYLINHYVKTGKFVCLIEKTKKLCPSYGFGKPGFECKHIKKTKKYLEQKNGKSN